MQLHLLYAKRVALFFLLTTSTFYLLCPDGNGLKPPTISPTPSEIPQKTPTAPGTQETEKKKNEEEPLKKSAIGKKRCADEPAGSANPSGICYLNATLQIIYKICCDDEVWAYIQKVRLRPSHRLAPLRKALLNFVNHYQEPRVQWNEDKDGYDTLEGQKWVNAVAQEITKLDPSHLGLAGGGHEYFALLYTLESLMGGAVNMNFSLKHTKKFDLPVGMLLSTTLYKHGPYANDPAEWNAFAKKLSSEPGKTWLERGLSFQARTEKMRYKKSVWPKFLIIVDFFIPDYDKPSQSPEGVNNLDPSPEELAFFKFSSQFSSFPLTLDLKSLGFADDPTEYTCDGFALSNPSHASTMILCNEKWYWCDDEIIESGKNVDEMVFQAASSGGVILPEETTEEGHFPEEVYAGTLYLYRNHDKLTS